jgi:transposase
MLLSEGQMSYYKSAALILEALPLSKTLHADRGYDADWFRNALVAKGIAPCIPSKRNRILQIPHDRLLDRQRHRIENMFGKLKDWCRIHPDMIDVPTPLCQPFVSLEPSPSGFDQ